MKKRDNRREYKEGPANTIWPVNLGHNPKMQEAAERLEMLGVNRPTLMAFGIGRWCVFAHLVE